MPWHLAHALSAVLHSMGSSRQDITSVSQPIVAMSRSKGYTASHLRSALTVDPMNGILAHTHHVMLQNTTIDLYTLLDEAKQSRAPTFMGNRLYPTKHTACR
mmetsp:Transcript_3486/g.12581  ORF Transcript_3486/g.12581 Transcript_3486/m.12581 type:complete len:102 (+) Transcript_3486:106-411(+)